MTKTNFSILSFLTILSLILVSCSQSKKTSSDSDSVAEIASVEEVDEENIIPIDIKVIHPEVNEYVDPDLKYKIDNANDTIIIGPSSKNFDGFTGKKLYEIANLHLIEFSESVEFLALDLFITNNSDKPYIIDKLQLSVEESGIDRLPYLYVG